MLSGGCVHSLQSPLESCLNSWSMAPKLSYLLMSCGNLQQSNNMRKVSRKTTGGSTSTALKKPAVLPSSNHPGTSRVSDATMIATSRNVPSTSVISSSVVSRIWQDYTSSARHGKVLAPSRQSLVQAPIASKLSKVKKSTTRGTSSSCVASTRSQRLRIYNRLHAKGSMQRPPAPCPSTPGSRSTPASMAPTIY